MSNKQIEEYLKTIEPNFDSHIEKGTIEMSNEYYNLLEERIIRLLNENKQLKEKLENDIDRYEDTISYQLGFDKGKEYLQQIIDNAKEYIKNILKWVRLQKDWETEKILLNLLILLGDKENE